MELIHRRCAGLDVHKNNVVACARVVDDAGVLHQETRTFETTTRGLLELQQWLGEHGVTHAVMEATGVYWKPVWHVLEESLNLLLGNAAHLRNVPGRKSDVADAVWLANLLAHGLVRGSFVPPRPIQDLRDLTRTRKQLMREHARYVQRIQKVLEDANVKLSSVISDVVGMSGRRILDAIVAGETSPERLASLAHERIEASQSELTEALRGRLSAHHRFLLKTYLAQIDALDTSVQAIDARIGEQLQPFREAAERLDAIPGVSPTAAAVIVSEIGTDMSRFPTAGHLISWAGLCPRMDESAGKKRSTRVRKGAPWLKTVLVQCALAAARRKDSYYRAQYHRLKARRGAKKAAIAVAASILTAAYHLLRDGVAYQDLGAKHFDKRDESRVVNRLRKRLIDLGYIVDLHKAAA
jgi:transposase